jgi:hypothetical protein
MAGSRSGTIVLTRYQFESMAAWEFLGAIEELFPSKYVGLLAIRKSMLDEFPAPAESPEEYQLEMDELQRRVDRWTASNGITSPIVEHAASDAVCGNKGPSAGFVLDDENEYGSIQAQPFSESLEQFLGRARRHYKEARSIAGNGNVIMGRTTLQPDHFRYLVAHLLGGCSFADMASGRTKFNFRRKSAATVAAQARKVAKVLHLELPTKPGPRRGRPAPRRHRRRR